MADTLFESVAECCCPEITSTTEATADQLRERVHELVGIVAVQKYQISIMTPLREFVDTAAQIGRQFDRGELSSARQGIEYLAIQMSAFWDGVAAQASLPYQP